MRSRYRPRKSGVSLIVRKFAGVPVVCGVTRARRAARPRDFERNFMNCLVTGGAGFLGSHLCDALLAQGHRVRIIERFEAATGNIAHILDRVELVPGDYANQTLMDEALAGMDAVFHLACSTHPKTSNDDPVFDVTTNLVPSLKLLDLSRKRGIKKVVYFSSGGTVYGQPQSVPIAESHPTAPICSYGIHKLAIEKYLELYRQISGLEYGVIRPANPFGERQRLDHTQGAVAVFIGRILRGEPIEIWGDGSVVRDYVYVLDVVDAAVRLLGHSGPVRTFNVGAGHGLSVLEVIDAISRAVGKKADIHFKPARKLDVPVNVLDISAAREHLGWSPQYDFETALARTVRHVVKAGH